MFSPIWSGKRNRSDEEVAEWERQQAKLNQMMSGGRAEAVAAAQAGLVPGKSGALYPYGFGLTYR